MPLTALQNGPEELTPDMVAAVDLGSNSFHMIVARITDGQLQIIDRLKEMVRLGEGLTEGRDLKPDVAARALACLERFGQRVRAMPHGSVRAVGTNTLRQLPPENDFINRAEQALGHPIDIIAGREEARLIYLGVAHGLAAGREKRLVVDIGGGSTELIVGEGFSSQVRESLHMGCVSMSSRWFADDRITEDRMREAELAGALEVRPVRELFRGAAWQKAVGSSGTIRAIAAVVVAQNWCEEGISAEALKRLRDRLCEFARVSAIELDGLTEERRPVFAGGVAVLRSVFATLNIEHMQVSDKALREGLLYEMVGRIRHEDVRERSVLAIGRRFGVDRAQNDRVRETALRLYRQAAESWSLMHANDPTLLGWAAQLHEIGLMIAHSQYQKHGAYVLRNADMPGFTRSEQETLAALVLGHRRKFPVQDLEALPAMAREAAKRLCVILRLAVLMHRGRSAATKPQPALKIDGNHIALSFPEHWLDEHPLTRLELEQEAERLRIADFVFEFA